ncbi:MAG: transglutaminaseTgpA domain-containing protein [Opitutales bacterium]
MSVPARQDRLSLEELHQLKWVLGGVLALLSLWTLFYLNFGSKPLVVVTMLVIAVALAFPGLPGRLPAAFWKAATPLLILGVLADFAVSRQDFLPPLIRLVTLLLLLRALAYRRRREDLQLILLCLFMVVVAGVLTVSLTFAVQIILFTPVAMALLFIVSLLESTQQHSLSHQDWKRFRWPRFIRRIVRVTDLKLVGFAGMLFALVVVVSTLIFVLTPRFRLDQAIPFLQLNTASLSGFTENIRFGDVTEIVEDNRVAMRLDPPDRQSLPPLPYWRMLVMDSYRSGGFRMSDSADVRPLRGQVAFYQTGFAGRLPTMDAPARGYWDFYLEGGISRYLPALGPYFWVRFQKKQTFSANDRFHVYNIGETTSGPFFFRINDMIPTESIAASRLDREYLPGADPVFWEPGRSEGAEPLPEYPMTQLTVPVWPEDVAFLQQAVAEITGGRDDLDAEAFGQAAVAWLEGRHGYSLRPASPEGETDPVVGWMRSGGPGHCEFFAGAFTLLARTAGYPARVVVGFKGGAWNTVEDYFVVRNRNAHAWCEIFDGDDRWIRFDPTPGSEEALQLAEAAGGSASAVESGWDAWVDSLRILWYRRVVNFDETSQEEIASSFVSVFKEMGRVVYDRYTEVVAAVRSWFAAPWTGDRLIQAVAGFFALLVVALLFLTRDRWLGPLLDNPSLRLLLGRRGDPVRKRAGKLLLKVRATRRRLAASASGSNATSARAESLVEAEQQLKAVRFGEDYRRAGAAQLFRHTRRLLRGRLPGR